MKVVTTFYRRLTLYECTTNPDVRLPVGAQDRRCDLLGPDQFAIHAEMRPGLPRSEFEARHDRGDLCVGVWSDDRLVHSGWVSTGPGLAPVRYLRSSLPLEPGSAYTYDVFTSADRRAEGYARSRDLYTRIRFAQLGHPKMLTLITPENVAGLRSIAYAGYEARGTYRVLRIGSGQRVLSPEPAGVSLPPLRPF